MSNVMPGYNEKFCYTCFIQPNGNQPLIAFIKEGITVNAEKGVDCKTALTLNSGL